MELSCSLTQDVGSNRTGLGLSPSVSGNITQDVGTDRCSLDIDTYIGSEAVQERYLYHHFGVHTMNLGLSVKMELFDADGHLKWADSVDI